MKPQFSYIDGTRFSIVHVDGERVGKIVLSRGDLWYFRPTGTPQGAMTDGFTSLDTAKRYIELTWTPDRQPAVAKRR